MTRILWTVIALFPLPLVVLLFAEPPELFERERVRAAYKISVELEASKIDWHGHFARSNRVALAQVMPNAARYGALGLAFERSGTDGQPVLVAPTLSETDLRYRIAQACWVLPADQITLLPRCKP